MVARLFLSTPSARRATPRPAAETKKPEYFYPRPPRGGRLQLHRRGCRGLTISIHALREEGDPHSPGSPPGQTYFYPRPPRGGRRQPQHEKEQVPYFYPRPPRGGRPPLPRQPAGANLFLSTPSARRATQNVESAVECLTISIHALREEGDVRCNQRAPAQTNFYPRPPRGGRRL